MELKITATEIKEDSLYITLENPYLKYPTFIENSPSKKSSSSNQKYFHRYIKSISKKYNLTNIPEIIYL